MGPVWFWFVLLFTHLSSCRRRRQSQKTVFQMYQAMNMPGSFWLMHQLKDFGCHLGERSKLCNVSVQGFEWHLCGSLSSVTKQDAWGWVSHEWVSLAHSSEGCRVYTVQHQHPGLCALLASYMMEKPKENVLKGNTCREWWDGGTVTPDLAHISISGEMGVQSLQTWTHFH